MATKTTPLDEHVEATRHHLEELIGGPVSAETVELLLRQTPRARTLHLPGRDRGYAVPCVREACFDEDPKKQGVLHLSTGSNFGLWKAVSCNRCSAEYSIAELARGSGVVALSAFLDGEWLVDPEVLLARAAFLG